MKDIVVLVIFVISFLLFLSSSRVYFRFYETKGDDDDNENGANRKQVLTFDGKKYTEGLPEMKWEKGQVVG